jgi:hypothetical protein
MQGWAHDSSGKRRKVIAKVFFKMWVFLCPFLLGRRKRQPLPIMRLMRISKGGKRNCDWVKVRLDW